MEERPEKTTTGTKEKNKLVITVGAVTAASAGSGSGIVVGIVFLGGVMATTAFAFLFGRRRRRRKSGDGKNYGQPDDRDHHSTAASADVVPCKLTAEKDINVERDFYATQNDMDEKILRNRSSSSSSSSYGGVHEDDGSAVSEKSFFRDKKCRLELEVNGGNDEDPLSNGKDVAHFSNPKVLLERKMQFDARSMDEDELPFPMDANKILHLSHTLQDTFSEEDNAEMRKDIEDNGELHCQEAAETAKDVGNFQDGSFQPAPGNPLVEVDDLLCPEHFGVNETNEKPDAICENHQDSGSNNTNLKIAEVGGDECKQHDSSPTFQIEENLRIKDIADHYEFNTVILMSDQLSEDDSSNGNHHQQLDQQMDESGASLDGGDEEEYSAPSKKRAENRTKNLLFREIPQVAKWMQDPKEILGLPKEEQFVKMQALISHLKRVYHNDGIAGKRVLIQKGIFDKSRLKSSSIWRYVLKLAELSLRTTNSHKRRILVFTALVLSGSLRFWYFSRPFLKLLLMHFRNYLMIKLHLMVRYYVRNHLKFKLVPKMLGL